MELGRCPQRLATGEGVGSGGAPRDRALREDAWAQVELRGVLHLVRAQHVPQAENLSPGSNDISAGMEAMVGGDI
eukprot:CAMPEP_0206165436 /NCGR_PEP_ID=MMETSP1474-20131121/20447_1 /ASSEMBLY_ACC=CAM_ASM_001110 /TAXON_ID=97495 /ORGANISM="Imantonia sp., Strain RCC918" /LENGTH=74 /DNA_ID=CAMNT_0053568821 /DNA_START=491 /DNA_END=716 /DNA_ORIENTATION=-